MDPDEFLKAKGAEEYEKMLASTVPLADLLWRKVVDAVPAETPEQKALFEKTLFAEVAKITDEKVRGYYLQDMKKRLFERFRPAAPAASTTRPRVAAGSGRRGQPEPAKFRPQTVKIALDEMVGKFIAAAMLCYPALIGEYEEKTGMFEIKDQSLRQLLEKMAEIFHADETTDDKSLCEGLKAAGLEKQVNALWEVRMIRQQAPDLRKLRREIDNKILEMQLKQLENEIKDCVRELEISESFSEELYRRCQMLKQEQKKLLEEHEAKNALGGGNHAKIKGESILPK